MLEDAGFAAPIVLSAGLLAPAATTGGAFLGAGVSTGVATDWNLEAMAVSGTVAGGFAWLSTLPTLLGPEIALLGLNGALWSEVLGSFVDWWSGFGNSVPE